MASHDDSEVSKSVASSEKVTEEGEIVDQYSMFKFQSCTLSMCSCIPDSVSVSAEEKDRVRASQASKTCCSSRTTPACVTATPRT